MVDSPIVVKFFHPCKVLQRLCIAGGKLPVETMAQIVIDGGTLKAGSTTAFAGLPQVDLTAAPGVTFDITSLNTTVGSISGGGPAGGTILLGGSTLTTGGNNGSTAFSGTISGVGGLTKTGTGSLTIGGTNNYTGTTRVSQGILILDAAAPTVLGGFVMSGADGTHARMAKPDQFGPGVVATFTSASGAWNRFDLLGKSQTLAGIQTGSATAQGGGVIQNRQQGNTTESSHGPVTLTLNGAGDYLFNGHLRNVDGGTVGTDTLALVKSGTGTQTLQGNVISYTGATTVSAGTLRLTNTTAFASPINNSATVDFVVNTTTNFGGNVAISGAGTYNKTGPATLVFNGTQAITATGQINIQQGTLQNNNNAVNWSGNKADIDVSAGAILDLYADPIFLDALTGSGIVQNNFGNASPAQSGASAFIERLVLGTNDGSGTFAGVIRDNATNQTLAAGAGRGGLQLEKTGSGTQTLAGVNTYTGITKVAAGTLLVNGSLAAGSAVTVESGATLGGSGTAAGTIAANGSIAPGTSIGTLATGTVTFGTTGSLDAEINSSTLLADKLAITGNLNLDPAAQLNLTDLGSGTPASAKFVLITYTGTWDGNAFAGTNDGGTVVVNGNTYTIDYNDIVGGTNAVTLNLGAGDPFDAWATANNITGGKGGDDDGDGVKNLLEFAAASNPNPATGGASSGPRCYPLMHAIGADKALTYTIAVRKGDLSAFAAAGNKQTATRDRVKYTIEASNTLADGWNTVQVTKVTGATATAIQTALGSKLDGLGADWEWHTFRTDAGAPADPGDFIRLKVEEAQ